LVNEYGLVVVHGDHPIEKQQRRIRKVVLEKIKEKKMRPAGRKKA